jgi:hypothetical protein
MSSAWTLTDANGVNQSLSDWGLAELTRELINQGTDSVTFRAEGTPSDADPLFAIGSTVRLFRYGTPWFYGRVVQVPGRASAQGEDQLYRLAGPWWYLENLVFQQTWLTTNGTTVTLIPTNKSRLILGQKEDGTKLNSGAAILEVLTYATGLGVPLTVGAVTPAAIAPYREALDQSCAEVIRNFLRWTPDATAAFDYTTTPFPTLSIHRRTDAATLTLPAYGAPVSGLDLTARHDLQAPSVVLKFEQTNDIDQDTFTSLIVQPAPATATGNELGAMVMTLDLSGARATYQKQKVRTAAIPTSDATPGVIDWWKGKFTWLNDFADGDLLVVGGSQSITIENPADYPGIVLSNVPNELLEGSVATWMNVLSAPLIVQGTLQYTGAETAEATDVWGTSKQRVLYTRVIGTNAETQTYSRLTSETAAEPVPAGLAQALFDAVGVLQYDGVLELTEPECSGVAIPGGLLNLSGGRAEWATMAAQIQRVEESIDLGQTPRGPSGIAAGEQPAAAFVPAERADDGRGNGERRAGAGRGPAAALRFRFPAFVRGDAGSEQAVPVARSFRYDGLEGAGECEFLHAEFADAERYLRDYGTGHAHRGAGGDADLVGGGFHQQCGVRGGDRLRDGGMERFSRAVYL